MTADAFVTAAVDITRLADLIEPELDRREMVDAAPSRIRRLQAERIARVVGATAASLAREPEGDVERPEGWTLIPTNPTPEMLAAFQRGFIGQLHDRGRARHSPKLERMMTAEQAGMIAMLAAPPPAPAASLRAQQPTADIGEALVRFVKEVVSDYAWGKVGQHDGGSIQDRAESLGLIVKTAYDPDKHGPDADAEPGDEYFEFSPALLSASTGSPGQSAHSRREQSDASLGSHYNLQALPNGGESATVAREMGGEASS